ncbi:hypothetical protein LINPERHAP2_LOCUS27868 [Linum perenne]
MACKLALQKVTSLVPATGFLLVISMVVSCWFVVANSNVEASLLKVSRLMMVDRVS